MYYAIFQKFNISLIVVDASGLAFLLLAIVAESNEPYDSFREVQKQLRFAGAEIE